VAMSKKAKVILGLAVVGGIVYLLTRPKKKEAEVTPNASLVMKLYQGGQELGDIVAPGIECLAVVTVTNASTFGGQPVAVDLTMRLGAMWSGIDEFVHVVPVPDQQISIPASSSLDVSFTFTFPAESDGTAGLLVCQALSPKGDVVAEIEKVVAIGIPEELIDYIIGLSWEE